VIHNYRWRLGLVEGEHQYDVAGPIPFGRTAERRALRASRDEYVTTIAELCSCR
jgi:hypothetical protein